MGLSGLVAGGVQSALDDVLDRRLKEQLRQQQETQEAARLALAQQSQQAQQENQRRTIDLADLRRRDDNNRQGLELMQQDKAQMDEQAILGSLTPEQRRTVDLHRIGITPEKPARDPIADHRAKAEIDAEFRPKPQGQRPGTHVVGGNLVDDNGKVLFASKPPSDGAPSPYATERAARTVQSVDELLGKVNKWTTGMGSLLSGIPESDARNFKAELDTLKANVAFNELTAMREASKTGGALGSVAVREMELLQSALGALDQGQSPDNLKAQLEKVRSSIERWQSAGGQAPMKPMTSRSGGGDAAAAAQALIDKARAARGGGL